MDHGHDISDDHIQLLASELAGDVREHVRSTIRGRQAASLMGNHVTLPGADMAEVLAAVRAEINVAEREWQEATAPHRHTFDGGDHCTVCGLDGRA